MVGLLLLFFGDGMDFRGFCLIIIVVEFEMESVVVFVVVFCLVVEGF